MSIDARIKSVIQDGNDLILNLEARTGGGLPGQEQLRIVDFTNRPVPKQEIWGGADTCRIEPLNGEGQTFVYRRVGYTKLKEK